MSVSPSRPDRPGTPTSTRPAGAPTVPATTSPSTAPATSARDGVALPVAPAGDRFAVRTDAAVLATDALVGQTVTRPERTEARAATGKPVPLKAARQTAKVFLSGDGQITMDPAGKAPANLQEKGDALYQAAELLDHGRPNLFSDSSISMTKKKALFANLSASLDEASVKGPLGGFANETQKLQQRASTGALLLNLAESLKTSDPKQKGLQEAAINRYEALIQAETNPTLRDSLIYNLYLAKPKLTEAQKASVNTMMRELVPLAPPYESWFKNGNKNLNVEVNIMGEFFDEEVKAYERNGFKKVSSDYGGAVLKKTFKENGVETEVTLNCRNSTSGVLNKMSDPNTHMVVYSGHANWGRLIRDELKRSPEQNGDKLNMILQCCGRGIMDNFAEKYPQGQLITTKFSSYADEDQNAFMKTIDGIAKRQPWQTISKSINGDSWNNSRRNYTFPSDPLFRKRQLDRDKDGMADAYDKVVNFNTFNVPADAQNSFTPRPQTVDPTRLEGGKIHNAVGMFNTTSSFSQFLEKSNKNQVVDAGWYTPKAGENNLLRVQKSGTDEDGKPIYHVQMNSNFAHASQESLNARAHYELHQHFLQQSGSKLSEQERKLSGLLLAAHSLDIDDGWNNSYDEQVFNKLRDSVGLPASVTLRSAAAALNEEHDFYSGSMHGLQQFKTASGLK